MAIAQPANCEDRISEVYYGAGSSERRTKRARDRIHWMCRNVRGSKVLDVGCSQGIATILLGREGYEVVGIDTSQSAIEFAEADLAKEAVDVRRRVAFRHLDLFAVESKECFDTIILGEILEHQVDAEGFLRRAMDPLREQGRVVITTPFGYAPHDDHKSTMFLSWLLTLSDLNIKVETCDVVDGYIRLVFTKLAPEQRASLPNPTELLRKTESGTVNAQRRLHAMIQQRQQEIEDLKELQKQADAARDTGAELVRVVDELNSLKALAIQYGSLSDAAGHLPDQIDQLRRTTDELWRFRNISQLEAELAAARTRESSLVVLSNSLKKTVRELETMRREDKVLRNSVSLAVGSQLVTAVRRPWRLFVLPVLLARAVRRAIAGRRRDAVSQRPVHRLGDSATTVVVDGQPVMLEQAVIPDQVYEFAIDIAGESIPCRKGLLLEAVMAAADLNVFLEINPHFRRRSVTGTAFVYVDITGDFLQRSSTVIRTGKSMKSICLSLTRFRGEDPVTAILYALRTVRPGEELTQKQQTGSPSAKKSGAKRQMRVLSILDTFTESCLEPEVELTAVSKSEWRQEVDESDAKMLFVESAWRGNGGEWNYALTKPEKHGAQLNELIQYCSSKGMPTVFWNKEDPANFDVFINAAKWFDYVFTTDSGSIENYENRIGKSNSFVLAFAAQPAMHNPVRFGDIIPRLAFTGSWRGVKYPARAKWIETLLDPLAEVDLLDIFDRYAGATDNPDLIFPETLRPAVKGALAYKDLVKQVYKRYAAFVNVNSVDSSETMLARRVFEILACGAPVISSPSPAMERTFGDIVLTPSSQREALATGQRLLTDLVFRENLASRGVRLVHSEHTYAHRLEEICTRVGLPYVARKPKLVSVICVSKRPSFLAHVHAQIRRQRHEHIELIFVQNSAAFQEAEIAARFADFNLRLLSIPEEKFLADGLNAAMQVAGGDYIAKFDDDDYYGANYLSDALLAFDYAPTVGVVGKRAFFAYIESTDQTVLRFPGQSYRFCRQVQGGTLVWDRRKLEGVSFEAVPRGTDTRFLEAARQRGVKVFSTDPFNFVHVRYTDKGRHTWTIEDEEFVSKAVEVGRGLPENLFLN